MEKHIFFRSDAHAKLLRFFDKVFMIRVAMGDVNFKVVPKASVFRGDADFEGPRAQKDHFVEENAFLKICFKTYVSKHIFQKLIWFSADFFGTKKTRNRNS